MYCVHTNVLRSVTFGIAVLLGSAMVWAVEPPTTREELVDYLLRFVQGIDSERMLNLEPDCIDTDLTQEARKAYRAKAFVYLPSDLSEAEIAHLWTLSHTQAIESIMFNPPGALEQWAEWHLLDVAANLCDTRSAVKTTPEERAAYEAAVDRYLVDFEKELKLATFSMLPAKIIKETHRRYRMDLLNLLYIPGVNQLIIPGDDALAALHKELVSGLQMHAEATLQAMGVIEGRVRNDQITKVLQMTTGRYHFSEWLEEPLHAFYRAAGWRPGIQSHCDELRERAALAKARYRELVRPFSEAMDEMMQRRLNPGYVPVQR